ncbi:MAG: sigma-70 family RNA polymerase sigma factor, partial [Limisphaerales bacterium]
MSLKIFCRISGVGVDILHEMTGSDFALLQGYVKKRDERAFDTLVQRYLPLVYTAALRQVRAPELAEEVAQNVFTDLAKNAPRLKENTLLSAWLYRVTRYKAIDCIRQESRRQLREQTALEIAQMNSTDAEWSHIEPLLDEGMELLDEQDRSAILLRFFENKSLREVGHLLGVSDDAAQKRVSRAVERLRDYFSRKGIAVSASSLCILLSANAVQAVPIGLVVKVLGTVAAGTVVTAVTKGIAMTTLQKTVASLAIAVAIGTGIYQAQQRSNADQELKTQKEQNRALQEERDNFARELAELRKENERLGKDLMDLHKLRGEVGSLKRELSTANKSGVVQPGIRPDRLLENPPVERFSATIRAAVEWDHALITG